MADALWLKCVDELKYQVPDNIFTMWIRPLSASMHDNTMVVNVPNQYFASYVEKNHLSQIQTILHQLEPTLRVSSSGGSNATATPQARRDFKRSSKSVSALGCLSDAKITCLFLLIKSLSNSKNCSLLFCLPAIT